MPSESPPVAGVRRSIDVLVVGSGGAGLAAALSAAAAGARVLLATKLGLASCNTAKAQGGIQAAFGAGRLARPARRTTSCALEPRDGRTRELVEMLTGSAPETIRWLEHHGVEFTREDGGYRLARCGGATRRRLLQVGDRTGHAIATGAAQGRAVRRPHRDARPRAAGRPRARRRVGAGDASSTPASASRSSAAPSCWPPAAAASRRPRRAASCRRTAPAPRAR